MVKSVLRSIAVSGAVLCVAAQQCQQLIGDPLFDLQSATPADSGYGPMCAQFGGSRCCSDNFTRAFGSGPGGAPNPSAIYTGYVYDQCPQNRTISAACLSFLTLQECNFACGPQLANSYAAGVSVPLCASYCDAWFAACADDFTCWTDWQMWPTSVVNGTEGYYCPQGSTCRTYAQVYTNGAGLCNRMWNSTYVYSTNTSVCQTLNVTSGALPNTLSTLAIALSVVLAVAHTLAALRY